MPVPLKSAGNYLRTAGRFLKAPGDLWYLAGGIARADCQAAYQPLGAASLLASYRNLAQPGSYDAVPVVQPAWSAYTGWEFFGIEALDTGLTPDNDQSWTMVIRFSGAGVPAFAALAGVAGGSFGFQIQPHRPSSGQISAYNGAELVIAGAAEVEGSLAVVGNQIYQDGDALAGTIAAHAGTFVSIYIGAVHLTPGLGGGAGGQVVAEIQAMAIYNRVLTALELGLLVAAMQLIAPRPTALLEGALFDPDALTDTIPPGAIYASAAGAALNSDFYAGGGTDDTAALQAVLDLAEDGVTEVCLVLDGMALTTGLKVYSNTTITAVNGGGLYLADGSDQPIIMGGTPSGTTITDHDIRLSLLRLNGNGANQAEFGADDLFVTGIYFVGVEDLTLSGLQVRDTRNWGVGIWNSENLLIENHTHRAVGTRLQQDAINLRSTTTHAVLRNIDAHTYDDAIALNNINWNGVGVTPGYGGPAVVDGGPITDVLIENVYLNSALFGIDLLSDVGLIDDITITGVTGQVENYWLALTNYNHGTGAGNFGTITVQDVTTRSYNAQLFGDFDEHVRINANVDSLELTRCRLSQTVDDRAYIRVFTGFTVTDFTVDDLVLDPDLAFEPDPTFAIDGTVTNELGNSW